MRGKGVVTFPKGEYTYEDGTEKQVAKIVEGTSDSVLLSLAVPLYSYRAMCWWVSVHGNEFIPLKQPVYTYEQGQLVGAGDPTRRRHVLSIPATLPLTLRAVSFFQDMFSNGKWRLVQYYERSASGDFTRSDILQEKFSGMRMMKTGSGYSELPRLLDRTD